MAARCSATTLTLQGSLALPDERAADAPEQHGPWAPPPLVAAAGGRALGVAAAEPAARTDAAVAAPTWPSPAPRPPPPHRESRMHTGSWSGLSVSARSASWAQAAALLLAALNAGLHTAPEKEGTHPSAVSSPSAPGLPAQLWSTTGARRGAWRRSAVATWATALTQCTVRGRPSSAASATCASNTASCTSIGQRASPEGDLSRPHSPMPMRRPLRSIRLRTSATHAASASAPDGGGADTSAARNGCTPSDTSTIIEPLAVSCSPAMRSTASNSSGCVAHTITAPTPFSRARRRVLSTHPPSGDSCRWQCASASSGAAGLPAIPGPREPQPRRARAAARAQDRAPEILNHGRGRRPV
mmetsp:Transcript_312/g.1038  ORF Transcript_312/g.1038 Transcript_312/m.1038 type:complete len:357 (-) Transcript_312:34-1104(-)